jgi:hypothetical protein
VHKSTNKYSLQYENQGCSGYLVDLTKQVKRYKKLDIFPLQIASSQGLRKNRGNMEIKGVRDIWLISQSKSM